MRVLITGVGDAFTSHHFGSSALIEAPGGYVLLDCPDLVLRALRLANESAGWSVAPPAINDIILTHLHGDHCNGLEALGFLRRIRGLVEADVEPRQLHTIEPVATRLWERLAPAMDAPFGEGPPSTLDDYFDVRTMTPGNDAHDVAGLSVRCRITHHPVPTIGLLITSGGVTLGWSGDTAFDPEHVEWLDAADVIIHESNMGTMHTPIEKLNGLPERIRRKMRLIHLPDDFDRSCTDLIPLREGELLDLG